MVKPKPVAVVLLLFLIDAQGELQGLRVCKDDYRDCGTWLRSGMCQRSEYKQFITNGCARTCGLCTDEMLTSPKQGLQDMAGPKQRQQALQKPGRRLPQLPQNYFPQTNAMHPLSPQQVLPPSEGYYLQTHAKQMNLPQIPQISKGVSLQTNTKQFPSSQKVILPAKGYSLQLNKKLPLSPQQVVSPPKGYSLQPNAKGPLSPQQVLPPSKGYSLQTNAKLLHSPQQKQALQKQKGRKFRQQLMRIHKLKNLPSMFASGGQRMADNNTINATSNATNPAEKSNCTDIFLKCGKWKEEKLCQGLQLKEYLKYGCAKTCRFCECRDTYRETPYCANWKQKGFCTTYPNQMDNYCPKTCLLCGDSIAPTPPTMVPSSTIEPSVTAVSGGTVTSESAAIGGNETPVEQAPIQGDNYNPSLEGTQVLKGMGSPLFKASQGGQSQQQPEAIIIRDSAKTLPDKSIGYQLPNLDLTRNKVRPWVRQGVPPVIHTFKRDQTDEFNLDDGFNDGNVPLSFSNFEGNRDSSFESKVPDADASYVQSDEEGANHVDGLSSELGILGKPTATVSENDKSRKIAYGDSTFLTPASKPQGAGDGADYYTENYSKDPDVAASQQMEEMDKMANTGETFLYSRSHFHNVGEPRHKPLRTKDESHHKKNRKIPNKK